MSGLTFGDTIRLDFKRTGQNYYVNKDPVGRIIQETEAEEALTRKAMGTLRVLGGIKSEKVVTENGVHLITNGPDGDTLLVFQTLKALQEKRHPVQTLDDAFNNHAVVVEQLKKLGALRPNVPEFQVQYHYQQSTRSAEKNKISLVFRNIGQFIETFCKTVAKDDSAVTSKTNL